MSKLEVFFDYACPYCLRGHKYLEELIPLYPQIEIEWRPCEAHPRPETYGPHSDLCIQGMFFALEHGIDIWAYHERIYRAALTERIDIEDVNVLSNCVANILDADSFRDSITKGVYSRRQSDSNNYAYAKSGVWAVPSYRMNGKKLDSIEDIGVTKEQLKAFIDSAK